MKTFVILAGFDIKFLSIFVLMNYVYIISKNNISMNKKDLKYLEEDAKICCCYPPNLFSVACCILAHRVH